MIIGEVVQKLAAASLEWAESNAVHFEISKSEAVLYSQRRKHWKEESKRLSGWGARPPDLPERQRACWESGLTQHSPFARNVVVELARPARLKQDSDESSAGTKFLPRQQETSGRR